MSAFVQINLELHEARECEDISGGAYFLGLHLACEANYFTKSVTITLKRLIEDLEWECSSDTAGRRLAELRNHGFVTYEVQPGRPKYTIKVTSKLVYDGSTSARPPHDLRTEGVSGAEPTSAQTSAQTSAAASAGVAVNADEASGSVSSEPPQRPPQRPPHGESRQERSRYRDRKHVHVEASAHAREAPLGSQSRPSAFVAESNGKAPEELSEETLAELEGSGWQGEQLARAVRAARGVTS